MLSYALSPGEVYSGQKKNMNPPTLMGIFNVSGGREEPLQCDAKAAKAISINLKLISLMPSCANHAKAFLAIIIKK